MLLSCWFTLNILSAQSENRFPTVKTHYSKTFFAKLDLQQIQVPTAPLVNGSATMVAKHESRSEPGNMEPKTRWYDKLRRKHKHKTAVQTDPQPSACEEGSKVGLVTLLFRLIGLLSCKRTDPPVLFKAADVDASATRKQRFRL